MSTHCNVGVRLNVWSVGERLFTSTVVNICVIQQSTCCLRLRGAGRRAISQMSFHSRSEGKNKKKQNCAIVANSIWHTYASFSIVSQCTRSLPFFLCLSKCSNFHVYILVRCACIWPHDSKVNVYRRLNSIIIFHFSASTVSYGPCLSLLV